MAEVIDAMSDGSTNREPENWAVLRELMSRAGHDLGLDIADVIAAADDTTEAVRGIVARLPKDDLKRFIAAVQAEIHELRFPATHDDAWIDAVLLQAERVRRRLAAIPV